MRLTNYAIDNKTVVYVLMLLIVIAGVRAYIVIPREAAPEVKMPYIFLNARYEGVSPEDVETTIIRPIEENIKGIKGIKNVYSTASSGFGSIVVEFNPNVDTNWAYREIQDKVNQTQLPQEIDDPTISEFSSEDFPMLSINLFSDTVGLDVISRVAEEIQENIESIPGILEVEIFGNLEREIRVEVDLYRLQEYNIPLMVVADKLRNENMNVGAGNIRFDENQFGLRFPGQYESLDQAYNMVIFEHNGNPVYLRDVATIVDTFKDQLTYSRFNLRPSVSMRVKKRVGANIIELTEIIKHSLRQAKEDGLIPKEIEIEYTGESAEYIVEMNNDLNNNIITGLLFVLIVLLVVMGFRTAFFVALAIPFSMLISFAVLNIAGITLNMIVMFALILALGLLVDNAVVIVENIYRHQQLGKAKRQAAKEGTAEVAWPVITSTATTVAAFLPLLFWNTVMGDFMRYLPMTVIIALVASLFVALVINPTLCSRFMNISSKSLIGDPDEYYSQPRNLLMRLYRSTLVRALKYRKLTILGSILFLISIFYLYTIFGVGTQFFPMVEPDRGRINIHLAQGNSLDKTDEVVRDLEEYLATFVRLPDDNGQYQEDEAGDTVEFDRQDIEVFTSNIGDPGERFSSDIKPHYGSIDIDFLDREYRDIDSEELVNYIRHVITEYTTFETIIEVDRAGPPTGAKINIEISGLDYNELGRLAELAIMDLKEVPGTIDLRSDFQPGRPEMQIYLDPSKPGLFGLTTNYIGGLLRSLVNGMKVSTFYFGEDEYDIVVRLPEDQRDDFQILNQLIIANDRGQQIPLDSLAELVPAGAPGTIKRVNYERVVTVSGDIEEGYVESDVLNGCRNTMDQLKSSISWTPGYDYEFTGEQQDQAEDMASLGNSFIMALFLILMILIAQFSALRAPLIIMTSVFMSISGVLIYLMVFQQPFIIIMVGLGIISLAGVVVNNAIVLIDYIQKQRKDGFEVEEAVIRAGMIRLRPVLLTAFTTILALMPMALGVSLDFVGEFEVITDSFSAEFWRDFSSSVIFGLTIASFLTLVIVPTLYYLFHRMQENLKKIKHSKAVQKIKSIKNIIPKSSKSQDQKGNA